ncbi:hypothetical protein BRC81_16315 [Halobacteriales archaeon QS_1_68_20]|nr:MAG: hypothetical protein BRC81_16315 [Halobacteriales archaeon QS_1_68_20]
MLSLAGGVGLATVAGCLEGGPAGDDSTEEPDENETPTPTPKPAPVLASKSFTVTGTESGESSQRAEVSFDDTIRINGTTTGNNGCYTAKLAKADVRDGTLAVTVKAVEDRDDDEMCTQALVKIDYEATFEFEDALPDRVVVKHDSMDGVETVVEKDR